MTPMASNASSSTHPEQGDQRNQFTDLLRAQRKQLGDSLTTVESRAVDPVTEKVMKRGRIYRLEGGEQGGVTPPDFWELRALAAAYRLPIKVLQRAAGQQFHGVDPLEGDAGESVAYVRKLDSLPPEQRDRLLRLIDTLVPPHLDDPE
jgi:hypothetical protein